MNKIPHYLDPNYADELEVPEEYKMCMHCEHFDANMAPFICYPADCGERELKYCNSDNMPQNTLVEADTDACPWFKPDEEARAAAEDHATYNADPYAYNGVSERDFL